MKKLIGELDKKRIIFKNPKEFGILYNKSHFGKTDKSNNLILNLIEGVYLLGENKIKIFEKDNEIYFKDLVKNSILSIPNFEIKYLVFKDLRKKGYTIDLYDDKYLNFVITNKINDKLINNKKYFISIFSENNIIDLNHIKLLINKVNEINGILWISIVDQEGDITYYKINDINIKGSNPEIKYKIIKAILTDDRVLVFNEDLSNQLFKNEFYGKPFGNGLQLSMVEALYLLKKGVLKIQNIKNNDHITYDLLKKIIMKKQPDINGLFNIFNDLKSRGLIVKTGFKFGSHFRAYSSNPDKLHAEYLIHVFNENININWSDFSRAVRLGHSVNKDIVFTYISNKIINYFKIERLRP